MNPKYLYLTVDLLTISVPFIASFYPKAPFYRTWKHLLPAILIPGIIFLLWDEWFTHLGIWGFNPEYVTGIYIGNLPIEEILFFICIPYACVFTYFAFNHLMEKDWFKFYHEIISSVLVIGLLILGSYHLDKAYTATTFLALALFIAFELLKRRARYLSRFYFTFLVILIPFFIVNGILTGSFIEGEVVWYNDAENLGVRMGTIPLEDTFYGMLLLMMNVALYEWSREFSRARSLKKKAATV